MKLEDLKEDVLNYKNTLKNINQKRKLWHTETKALILNTLKSITKTYELDWDIEIMESTRNLEGINLTLGNSISSTYSEDEKGKKRYAKTGGNLVFSQAYNGDVFIIFMTPSIDNFNIPQDPQKIIGKVNPAKINEEFIILHISQFLIELADWESLMSSHIIGFKA
ncbi:MAG: hypothetical protein GQ574_15350 [Crocinitomix sp.]|nr:hypothetical protein [Crocinitomix sp.]